MQKKDRESIPAEIADSVLFLSDRTCCVCHDGSKSVQIHHIDEDPSNNNPVNLAVLCLECHLETQLQGGFNRKLNAPQVRLYRDDWLQIVSSNRSEPFRSPIKMVTLQEQLSPKLDDKKEALLFHTEEPVIVWRLPRGAMVLSDLLTKSGASNVAEYCSYDGSWHGGTHYHAAYHDFWWGKSEGIETQYRKLQIERGDWQFARRPLELMSEIAEGNLTVQTDGKIEGEGVEHFYDPELTGLFCDEDVPLPHVPERYARLVVSGALRDLAAEMDNFLEGSSTINLTSTQVEEAISDLKWFRRTARIEAAKIFARDDPAMVNLIEVVTSFDPIAKSSSSVAWLKELRAVLYEAICVIHESRK